MQRKWMMASAVLIATECFSCSNPTSGDARSGILAAEAAFAKAAASKGVKEAFVEFADDSAVINRGGKLYRGKAAIGEYYSHQPFRNVQLNWAPDYVRVAESGDLGYTYGKYQFYAIDSAEKKVEFSGIFHTVWHRQKDGSWRFLYD